MLLEIATTLGAVVGASLALRMQTGSIAAIFGIVLLYSAYVSTRIPQQKALSETPDRLSAFFRLDSSYPTPEGPKKYRVHNVPVGSALMFTAGILSGLLGIGSGAVKVIAMDQAMHIPFKVSTTTSNFMIGVTAAASAGVYLKRGYIDPVLSFPVMLGVLAGALLGARILTKSHPKHLRLVFSLVVVALALEMVYRALQGTI